jgi:predicted DCC family thiol-disulfide oxidoreductase YuxK
VARGGAARIESSPGTVDGRRLPPRIIFYDGLCAFCDGRVAWILERDGRRRFHYAALQGKTAEALRDSCPEAFPHESNSLIYWDSSDAEPVIHQRSRAVFEILRELGGPYRMVSWLRILPHFITDLPYRLVARVRYRLYGSLDECRVPDARVRSLFLD